MSILMYIGFGFIISSPVWLYLLAKIDPRVSRVLHKVNCDCDVCYPDGKQTLGEGCTMSLELQSIYENTLKFESGFYNNGFAKNATELENQKAKELNCK